ncbi:MAG: hypothetical protein NTX72_05145 [Candidatus Uhrbacteria bacterium]|nr:hypothetical protein [Candidatus Uhrbacteria bacterium]
MLNPLFWLSIAAANVDGLPGKLILGFFLLLILIGVVCRIVLMQSSKDRYLKLIGKRLVTCSLTMGITGVILYFFSYEGIQLFGARFWYLIWVVAFIAWVTVLVKFVMKEVPEMRNKNVNQHAKSKYIPGRKK